MKGRDLGIGLGLGGGNGALQHLDGALGEVDILEDAAELVRSGGGGGGGNEEEEGEAEEGEKWEGREAWRLEYMLVAWRHVCFVLLERAVCCAWVVQRVEVGKE
jgi:hypothetical protein